MPVNRLVALATPLFAALTAVITALVRKHCPGLPVPSTTELTGLELTGAAAASAAALKWLHGHQKWEARVEDAEHLATHIAAQAQSIDPAYTKQIHDYVQGELASLEAKLTTGVSDAEEFANQPPVTAAESPRPESAAKPDAPATVPVQAVVQPMPAAQPVAGAQAVPAPQGA
ncbi:MAG TPA: hypothetical protein VK730_13695 [Solirubrobacteraceae bacterium]|jgi:hypothetical protein|nr:hypothetical protein [Solirubrobacteraceae bacterium]